MGYLDSGAGGAQVLTVAVMLKDETWVYLPSLISRFLSSWFVRRVSVLICVSRREIWSLHAGPHSKRRTCNHRTDVTYWSHRPQTGMILSMKDCSKLKVHLAAFSCIFRCHGDQLPDVIKSSEKIWKTDLKLR